MSTSTNDLNPETATLDAIIIREYLNFIVKFGLLPNIAQYIDTYLTFHNVYIIDFLIALNIEVNLWVFICLKSYHFTQTLVIYSMLKVFCNKFYG